MVDVQDQLLREIADKRMTRDDVKMTYASALRQRDQVDFKVVHAAILDRWSRGSLRYIRDGAWRVVRAQRKVGAPT